MPSSSLVATASVAGAVCPVATRLATEVSAALTAGSVLLGLGVIVTLALIVPASRAGRSAID